MGDNLSTSKRANKESSERIELLKQSYQSGASSLVLGSGISRPFNIPDWPTLLRKIVDNIHADTSIQDALVANQANPLILARYIRKHFEKRKDFLTAVHLALYDSYSDNFYDPVMRSIVSYCQAQLTSGASIQILTYNFDCVLEKWLSEHGVGISYTSADFDNRPQPSAGVEVFHCHGTLPFKLDDLDKRRIVFDETEYHGIYYDHYNLSNLMQVAAFSDRDCIFIGVSLSDPNMRRLLDYASTRRAAQRSHFVFRKKPEMGLIIGKGRKTKAQRELMEVFEVDAKSLGVETVWVNDYSDISQILTEVIHAEI